MIHGEDGRAVLRGVVFDSGDTLVRPVGGSWWPGAGFATAVRAYYPDLVVDGPNLHVATQVGIAYLDKVHAAPIHTVEQEREQFAEFFRIVLAQLGCRQPDEDLIARLAHNRVHGHVMEPFHDTRMGLERLQARGLALAVVSNAWPSLEEQYRRLGLFSFFDAFVVSAHLGRCKPEPEIYLAVCSQLGASPNELLFVDDSADNVKGAQALGFVGLVMKRTFPDGDHRAGVVHNMSELEGLLESGLLVKGI
jgi:putative hydrolase of the HAD superfamily